LQTLCGRRNSARVNGVVYLPTFVIEAAVSTYAWADIKTRGHSLSFHKVKTKKIVYSEKNLSCHLSKLDKDSVIARNICQ